MSEHIQNDIVLHKDLENLCQSLETLAQTVARGTPDGVTYCEIYGSFGPAITSQELASIAFSLATEIRATKASTVPIEISLLVTNLPNRLNILQNATVPHLMSTNVGQALSAYMMTIQYIRSKLIPEKNWIELRDDKSLPKSLVQRIQTASSQLDQAVSQYSDLEKKMKEILLAHSAARSLPSDLLEINEAKEEFFSNLRRNRASQSEVESFVTQIKTDVATIFDYKQATEKLVSNCEEAYRITTSKGLAGAFEVRAEKLSNSMWVWVCGLIIALGLTYLVGSQAIALFMKFFEDDQSNWLGLQATLSALGVFAPLWFAWVATKQIGERFRLSEDYAFKAAVSKAYEGYRREAASLDPAFAAKLFASALSRLDEPPLRLVEIENHGSPWHELSKLLFSTRYSNSSAGVDSKANESESKR